MQVVITGGMGFIGRRIVNLLAKNEDDEIYILDNLKRHGLDEEAKNILSLPNVSIVEGDLTDANFLTNIDIKVDRLYHLAAFLGVGNVINNPIKTLRVNTISTLNIIDWYQKNRNEDARFLFSSSSEVYSGGFKAGADISIPTPEDVPLVIEDIQNPRYSYALSKMWGEAYLNYLSSEYNDSYISVRYHNVYGPGMGYQHVIPQIISRIQKNEDPFRIIGGEHTRSFCWVDDAALATIKVMESNHEKKGVIHIGDSGNEVSIQKLYNKIFKICNFNPENIKEEGADSGCVSRRCPDTSYLIDNIGYKISTSFESGLKKTVDWYLKNPEKEK